MSSALAAVLSGGGVATVLQAQEAGGAQPAQGLEEVVVTARFREEALQDVPLTISAFSATELRARGIEEIESLGDIIPNAYARPTDGVTPAIGIRGKISHDHHFNDVPTVALYIDDVLFSAQTGMNASLYDVERVEVHRGPQGTRFGRNSIAGAIQMVSVKPEGDNTGYIEAAMGSYKQLDLQGAFDIPLVEDRIFMRVTGSSRTRDGYIDRLDWACEMKRTGRGYLAGYGDGLGADGSAGGGYDGLPDMVEVGGDADLEFSLGEEAPDARNELKPNDQDSCKVGTFNGINVQGGRVQLRFVGSDNFDVNVSADYSNTENESFIGLARDFVSAGGSLGTYIQDVLYPAFGITNEAWTSRSFVTPVEDYTSFENYLDPINDQNLNHGANMENLGVSLTVDWDISSTLSLRYIFGHRVLESLLQGGGGGGNVSRSHDATPFHISSVSYGQELNWTQHEVRLSGQTSDRFFWSAGVFYLDEDDQKNGSKQFPALAAVGSQPSSKIYGGKSYRDSGTQENASIYGNVVYDINDRLSATLGMRYTDEQRTLIFDQPPVLSVERPGVSSATSFDWRASIDYNLSAESMLFASVATGYRSGGINPRPWTAGQVLPFPQEEVVNYEFGTKSDFFDRRLRINLTAFYEDYDPRVLQLDATQCNEFEDPDPGRPYFEQDLVGPDLLCPSGTPLAGTEGFSYSPYTSSPGTISGLELELTASLTDNLTLGYTFGYNEFEVDQDDPTADDYRHPDSLSQPEENMSASLQYERPMSFGNLLFRLDWRYQGHYTASAPQVAPDPDDIIPSYSVYDAAVTYRPLDERWEIGLRVRNLLDEFYWVDSQTISGDHPLGQPGEPQRWTLTFRREFGLN